MQGCGAWAGYGDGAARLRPCWCLRRALMGNESQGSSLVVAMLVARNVPFCHATPRTSAQCVSCIQTPGASLAPGGMSLRRCMMVLGCRSGGVRVASSRPRKSHEPRHSCTCGRRCLLSRLSERCAAAGGLAAPPLCLTCGEPSPPSAPAATTRTGWALCPCVGHGEDQGPRAGSSLAMTRATVAGASASPCSAIAYRTALSRLSPDTETAIRGALPGVE